MTCIDRAACCGSYLNWLGLLHGVDSKRWRLLRATGCGEQGFQVWIMMCTPGWVDATVFD